MNIKRFTAFLMSGLMAVSMVSCGDKDDDDDNGDKKGGNKAQSVSADDLVGDWTLCDEDGNADERTLRFNDDDTYGMVWEYSGKEQYTEYGSYKYVDEETISIEINEETVKSDYEIVDKKDREIYIEALVDYLNQTGANSGASTMLKAANSALEELDEDSKSVSDGTYIHYAGDGELTYIGSNSEKNKDEFMECLGYYTDGAESEEYAFYVYYGVAVAAAFYNNGYYGTSPATDDTQYDSLEDALEAAKGEYLEKHPNVSFND